MTGGLVSSWVGVSPRPDLADRIGSAGADGAGVFGGCPLAIDVLPEGTRRVPQAAARRCLELLAPAVGGSYADTDVLLVFAGALATAFAQRLVVAVDEGRRLRPSDSTDMEASESIRGALAALGRGRPRCSLVVASAFDGALAASLIEGAGTAVVVRYELHGPRPEDCDVFAACIARHPGGGADHD